MDGWKLEDVFGNVRPTFQGTWTVKFLGVVFPSSDAHGSELSSSFTATSQREARNIPPGFLPHIPRRHPTFHTHPLNDSGIPNTIGWGGWFDMFQGDVGQCLDEKHCVGRRDDWCATVPRRGVRSGVSLLVFQFSGFLGLEPTKQNPFLFCKGFKSHGNPVHFLKQQSTINNPYSNQPTNQPTQSNKSFAFVAWHLQCQS